MKTVEQRVIRILALITGHEIAEVKLTDDIQADLGADSIDVVEILMALEDEYLIEISDAQAEHLLTVQKVVTFIEKALESQAPAPQMNGAFA